MPKITEYKISEETIGAYATDQTVSAADFERFRSTLEIEEYGFRYSTYSGYVPTGNFTWRPSFPAGLMRCATTIPEEALYESNMRSIVRIFKDYGHEIGGDHGIGEFTLENTHQIALACSIEEMCSEYPVVNEDDYSDLQLEKEGEEYDEYGKKDLIEKLYEWETLEFIFDTEEEVILPEFEPILDPILREMASYAVSYSGEMYFGEDTLRSAIADLTDLYMSRDRLPALITALAMLITVRKARADREAFESAGNQPLSGLEVY